MPDDITMTDYHATAPDGAQIPMRWYAKKGWAPGSAVLYTHGGGMIGGSMDLSDRLLAGYVYGQRDADAVGGLPAGSRAPLSDAGSGCLRRSAVAGRARQRARRRPGADRSDGRERRAAAWPSPGKILIYPMLDDRTTTIDAHIVRHVVWKYDDNVTGWGALLGNAAGGSDEPATPPHPRASPIRPSCPPAYIEVGQLGHLPRRGPHLRSALGRAGVEAEFHLRPGVPHMFRCARPHQRRRTQGHRRPRPRSGHPFDRHASEAPLRFAPRW
jgi:acetyl esterase/lipase